MVANDLTHILHIFIEEHDRTILLYLFNAIDLRPFLIDSDCLFQGNPGKDNFCSLAERRAG